MLAVSTTTVLKIFFTSGSFNSTITFLNSPHVLMGFAITPGKALNPFSKASTSAPGNFEAIVVLPLFGDVRSTLDYIFL